MKTTNKYPYYEKDQVLSAQNLNDTTNYLEHQDLLTRRLLIGTGIACGLEFSYEEGVITIVAGNGVTSKGYIIDFCTTKAFSKIRDYNLPDRPKYHPFYGDSKKPFQLWELCDEETNEGDNLEGLKAKGEKFIRDKVLVLFLEIDHVDLKNCVEGDCDDKGSEFVFKVVPLLLNIQDLILYFSKDGDTLEDLNSAVYTKYSIKEIKCPRFDVLANRLVSHQQIAQSFLDNINLITPQIDSAFGLMQLLYADKLGLRNSLTDAWRLVKKQLEAAKKEPESVQQAYNYLCTLADAINQFTRLASDWVVSCCPDIDLFPQHLALGELVNQGNDVPKLLRNYFVFAPTSPLAHEKQSRVKFYYERVFGILSHYKFGTEDQVKIVPSAYGRTQLSEKAIPFYLQQDSRESWDWLKKWNYAKSDYGRWKKNTYYYNTPEAFLDLDIEPYSFFRVEGHIGKNYMDAISSIQKEIDAYRVPIKLVALSTGGLPIDANPIPESRFQDLEALFDAAKSELFCSLEGPLCFLASISFNDIYGRKTAEKSIDVKSTTTPGGEDIRGMFGKTTGSGGTNTMRYEKQTSTYAREYIYQNYIVSHIKGQFLAQKCNVEEDTFGSAYLEAVKNEPFKSTRLLDLYQNQIGISTSGQAKILLLILLAIDEIEELVALVKPATLSSFKFNELKSFLVGFRNMLDVFIDLMEAYKASNDNSLPGYLDGIIEKLKSLRSICSLKKIVTILNEHRLRTLDILEEWKFENFTRKHPGIDHKAGTTKGGTFIIVFHSTEEPEKYEPLTLDDLKTARPQVRLVSRLSMAESAPKTTTGGAEASYGAYMGNSAVENSGAKIKKAAEQELYRYAKETGRVITQSLRDRFEGLFIEENLRESLVPPTDGMVLFDFFLPYVCCGDGGVEYNLPEPKVMIALEKREFCKNDKGEYEFILSPKGGQVTGPGLRQDGDDYFFVPSHKDVDPGKIAFSYVVQGRAASFSVQVSEAPEADFSYSIDSTPNGSYVSFTNKSKGAKGYLWKFGDDTGSTSKEENPTHYYSPKVESAKVVLVAKNDICGEHEKEVEIQLFEKSYEMTFVEVSSFCENDKSEYDIIVLIKNRGEELPLTGTVNGPGVKPPTSAASRARFSPASAGAGTHKLTYDVDGKTEATLNATVEQSFVAGFSASTKRSEFGIDIKISDIKPKDGTAYFWYMNPNKPTSISTQKSDSNDFSFLLDSTLVANQSTFPIRLEVYKGACSDNHQVTITNPFANNTPGGGSKPSNPFAAATALTRQKVFTDDIKAIDTTTNKTTLGTGYKALIAATTLLEDVTTKFETASTQKKLLAGSSNTALSKTYKKALDGLETHIVASRVTATKKKTALAARAYVNVYMSMVNLIFAQSSDLAKTNSMYTVYSGADAQIEKAYKAGLTTKMKTAVKSLNDSAASSTKPNVSAVATNNKTVLK